MTRMKKPEFDFAGIQTFSARSRRNLVTLDNLLVPDKYRPPDWQNPEFEELVQRVKAAGKNQRPIVWSIGAHVIKKGLSLYLIDLIKSGFISHIAGNGAVSIHDFELAYLGGTSEDVSTALEDGSFGMWEETGRWMNQAIQAGWQKGLGYGEALARYIDRYPQKFPYRDKCVLYQAWKHNVPATFFVAVGTDIIHQHPTVDFAALGGASGEDFKRYCRTVCGLEGGVFLNFGSAVIGPEVFLKALSIARNLGFAVKDFTTANFDLIDLGNYRSMNASAIYNYYYRPWKNIVCRPVASGGKGFHFSVDHQVSIPLLWQRLQGAK